MANNAMNNNSNHSQHQCNKLQQLTPIQCTTMADAHYSAGGGHASVCAGIGLTLIDHHWHDNAKDCSLTSEHHHSHAIVGLYNLILWVLPILLVWF